jgi:hypothetical protein
MMLVGRPLVEGLLVLALATSCSKGLCPETACTSGISISGPLPIAFADIDYLVITLCKNGLCSRVDTAGLDGGMFQIAEDGHVVPGLTGTGDLGLLVFGLVQDPSGFLLQGGVADDGQLGPLTDGDNVHLDIRNRRTGTVVVQFDRLVSYPKASTECTVMCRSVTLSTTGDQKSP